MLEPPADQVLDLGAIARGLQADRSWVVLEPVLDRLGEQLLELVIEILEARDDHDRRGKPADQVAERGHRLAELHRRLVEVEDILELIDAENQRHAVDGPDHLPQALDHPVRGVGIGTRHDAAEQPAVVGRQVLAPQVLEHSRLDPGIIALEVEKRLDEVNIDLVKPLVQDHAVGHRADDPVDRRLIELTFPKLLELTIGGDSGRFGKGVREPHQTGTRRLRLVVRPVERFDQVVQDVSAVLSRERGHLHVAAVAAVAGVDPVAKGPHQVGLAASRFTEQQQDPAGGEAAGFLNAVHGAIEPVAGGGVDRLDVERISLPDVVAVGERMKKTFKPTRAKCHHARVVVEVSVWSWSWTRSRCGS